MIAAMISTQDLDQLDASPQVRAMLTSLQTQLERHSREMAFKQTIIDKLTHENAVLEWLKFAAQSERFNEVHPHSSLKMRSPREFRRHQAA
jgi:transposase